MDFELPKLRREEKVALQLRALFEKNGYRLFRMGSFEEYDLYLQNKPFLTGEDIITFTSADGRLMALKPDVTLSIVKNTREGETKKVYYTESVFRRSRQTGDYREINQMGLEFIGGESGADETEVLCLAAQSLAAIGESALDVSHMGIIEAVLALFNTEESRAQAQKALQTKSAHNMRAACQSAGLANKITENLSALAVLSGRYGDVLPKAKMLLSGIEGAGDILNCLEQLFEKTQKAAPDVKLRVDFSILNDADYYNGLIFQGYINGISREVMAGGRYDNLLQRFGKKQCAVGFALYLDTISQLKQKEGEGRKSNETEWLNVALPKGRMGEKVYKLFEEAGLSCKGVLEESRKLVFEDEESRVRYFLVKPGDVDIYVEHGAADIGVVGRDVLLESGADVLELYDLKLGACRLAVAGMNGFVEDPARPLRVATKYPAVARAYYAQKSRAVEIIKLHGSIELAPILGLSDVIVDIVETGSTLKENNLSVFEDVEPSSARLIANRAAWPFKENSIRTLLERLDEIL